MRQVYEDQQATPIDDDRRACFKKTFESIQTRKLLDRCWGWNRLRRVVVQRVVWMVCVLNSRHQQDRTNHYHLSGGKQIINHTNKNKMKRKDFEPAVWNVELWTRPGYGGASGIFEYWLRGGLLLSLCCQHRMKKRELVSYGWELRVSICCWPPIGDVSIRIDACCCIGTYKHVKIVFSSSTHNFSFQNQNKKITGVGWR